MDDDMYVTLEERVKGEKEEEDEDGDTGQQGEVEESEEDRRMINAMLWGRWRK